VCLGNLGQSGGGGGTDTPSAMPTLKVSASKKDQKKKKKQAQRGKRASHSRKKDGEAVPGKKSLCVADGQRGNRPAPNWRLRGRGKQTREKAAAEGGALREQTEGKWGGGRLVHAIWGDNCGKKERQKAIRITEKGKEGNVPSRGKRGKKTTQKTKQQKKKKKIKRRRRNEGKVELYIRGFPYRR